MTKHKRQNVKTWCEWGATANNSEISEAIGHNSWIGINGNLDVKKTIKTLSVSAERRLERERNTKHFF